VGRARALLFVMFASSTTLLIFATSVPPAVGSLSRFFPRIPLLTTCRARAVLRRVSLYFQFIKTVVIFAGSSAAEQPIFHSFPQAQNAVLPASSF